MTIVAVASPLVTATEDFASLLDGEYVRLFRTLFLLTGSRWEAEDLTHEALTVVLERWDRVRGMESPSAYLYTVAINLHRRRVRRLLRRVILHPDPGRNIARPGPEAEVEARSDVVAALSTLPVKLREALVLSEYLELDSAELGRRLEIAPSSARARVHRARAAVRNKLGGTYE